MVRPMTTAIRNELGADAVKPRFFTSIETDSSVLFLWNGNFDIVFDGDTYLGNGQLVGIGAVQESEDIEARGIEIQLTGEPTGLLAIILADISHGNACTLHFGFLDANENLIADPILLFEGRLDAVTFDDDTKSAVIKLNYESVLIELERSNEFRYNDNTQQGFFPGDIGFEFMEQLVQWSGYWGKRQRKKRGKKRGRRRGSGSR